MFKERRQKKLEDYVRQYFASHPEVKLVGVAGSFGKTTTKMMIATLLSQKYRVRMDDTSHVSPTEVALDILGISRPQKDSIFEWHKIYKAARERIKQPADVDVIVQEFDTGKLGDLNHFASYLNPDIAVITGVSADHLQDFGSIEGLAQEELSLANFSKTALINRDDIEGRFAEFITNPNLSTYGTTAAAEYRFEVSDVSLEKGYEGKIFAPELLSGLDIKMKVYGEEGLRSGAGAAGVGLKLGLEPQSIVSGLATISPLPGRMNLLRGVNQSLILDDTYDSNLVSAANALQTLYGFPTPDRIALFGDMKDLGAQSESEHGRLGSLCDSNLLSWVVTVGEETEKYLAPRARANGCQVKTFKNPIDAGAFVHSVIEPGALVLAAGSDTNILEESLKIFLHDTHENRELVRQDEAWLEKKNEILEKIKK
ncbi:MAG TPA: Mur ligase family protein [Candidatus Saccharimonadales bacterium]